MHTFSLCSHVVEFGVPTIPSRCLCLDPELIWRTRSQIVDSQRSRVSGGIPLGKCSNGHVLIGKFVMEEQYITVGVSTRYVPRQ